MGMTMTQKIIAAHAAKESVQPGEMVMADVDIVLANDITGPLAIREMNAHGMDSIFNKDKIALVPDHFAPAKDIKSAEQCKMLRDFAWRHQVSHYYEVGRMGVEHCLLPEQGVVGPGDLIVGADSHTCTYGALGAFATGMGSTDIAAAMVSGKTWLRVPEAIRVTLVGDFISRWVSGKDVILHLIGEIGVDGARYQSLEFTGPGVQALSMDSRFTMANMAIEAGAKNGIFPVDERTEAYIKDRFERVPRFFAADDDATYSREVVIDLSKLSPQVAFPHLPENVHPVEEGRDIFLDQVVIGSCTNGRLEDMRVAADVLKNRKVADYLRLIVIPGTQEVYDACVREGIAETVTAAGGVFSTPTCGPCLGGHMGILAKGERALSTTNRNFVGRMGHPESEVYLANPAVAAASAITGYITHPKEVHGLVS